MTELLPASRSSSVTTDNPRGRGLRYLLLGLLTNAVFWGAAFLWLKDAPRLYTSRWTVMSLSKSTPTNVATPNGTPRIDSAPLLAPDARETYKVIATTDSVRKAAASKLGMTMAQFGTPVVEVVPGTAMIKFEITSSTPEDAQKKAYALHEAFQEQLNKLRMQQATDQQSSFENALNLVRKRLEVSQLRLSDYKNRSGLVSKNQIDQLAGNIEELRRSRAELMAQRQDISARLKQLSGDLNLSSQEASEAFTLRSDGLLQQFLKTYNEATANLTALSEKLGPNHPAILRESSRQTAAEQALQQLVEALLGRPVDPTLLAKLDVTPAPSDRTPREPLFKEIVTNQAEQQGLEARIKETDRQLQELEKRLGGFTQSSTNLATLNRDLQMSESIFSSTLANLDTGRANTVLQAYPPIQLLAEPNLPAQGRIPEQKVVLTVTTFSSLLVSVALFFLWFRKSTMMNDVLPRKEYPNH